MDYFPKNGVAKRLAQKKVAQMHTFDLSLFYSDEKFEDDYDTDRAFEADKKLIQACVSNHGGKIINTSSDSERSGIFGFLKISGPTGMLQEVKKLSLKGRLDSE